MQQIRTNITVIQCALKKAYVSAVLWRAVRAKLKTCHIAVRPEVTVEVARKLGDVRLAKLFVEAQFASMPEDWCESSFKRPYPPVGVVFGAKSWERYRNYVDAGRAEILG